MIFGKYYDKSLWVMSCGKKKEDIIKFVESIPEELIRQIQKSLILYQYYAERHKDVPEGISINFSGEVVVPGDMGYWYSIDKTTGALDLGEYIKDDKDKYDTFQMTLYPLKRKQYNSMESFDEHFIGDVSYNYINQIYDEDLELVDSDTMEFSLVKFPFGIMGLCSSEMSVYNKNPNTRRNRYSYVDMKKAPGNYSVSDLREKNKLVRRRKKNKNSK